MSTTREQGWCSGESTRLPPVCPGFDSRTRRDMWVEFVVCSLLCSERFFSGFAGFPLSSKTNTYKFLVSKVSPISAKTFGTFDTQIKVIYLFIFYFYCTNVTITVCLPRNRMSANQLKQNLSHNCCTLQQDWRKRRNILGLAWLDRMTETRNFI